MASMHIVEVTNYSPPVKRIFNPRGLSSFRNSVALQDITTGLATFTSLVQGKSVPKGALRKQDLYTTEEIHNYERDLNALPVTEFEDATDQLSQIYESKPIVKNLVGLVERCSRLIDETPPEQGPRRFGNLSRRQWQDKLDTRIDNWLNELIVEPFYNKPNSEEFIKEIKYYILNSFGSRERLDYGTGHELSFLAFLIGLWKVGIFIPDDEHIDGFDILVIFSTYYTTTRKLITTYTLEPAGSHGVWGLDDHFHIIYILGASQMLNTGEHQISPRFVQDRSVVFQHCEGNLYFNAIGFINKVKKAPFFEHSPILYDVSNVKEWEKILKGMQKMYDAEVLNKFPVVQHFYFGGVLFPWVNAKTGKELPVSENADETESNNDEPVVATGAPWKSKKPQASFQDKIISGSQAGRLPTRMSSQGRLGPGFDIPGGDKNQVETTRAPWARK